MCKVPAEEKGKLTIKLKGKGTAGAKVIEKTFKR